MDIDAIQQRPRDFRNVTLDHRRSTHALAGFVIEIPTGTRIHRRREHETRRKTERHRCACDGYSVILEGLAHHFENVARELWQLIEEEKTVVRQRYFPGSGHDTATDEAGVGDGVMG